MAETDFFQRVRSFPRKYLWRAPRAFVLKLTRDSDGRLADMTRGKRVAIVGNAQSLLTTSHGTAIDDHDVVVRLNKGFPIHPDAQGKRTDIVSLTPEISEQEVIDNFAPKAMLLLTPKLRHLRINTWENTAKVLFYPNQYWFAERKRIGCRPSSGYMAISYIMRIGRAKSISVYGFDFGKTATYYNPPGYETPHDFAREGDIVRGWHDDGRITIVPSP